MSVQTATKSTAPAKLAALDIKLMVPFINAIRNVFSTMVGIPAEIQRPSIKAEPAPLYDVSGIIGFSGGIVGSVVASFPRETAIKLVASFAGSELEPSDPDFADAIGELTNMIAGAAKRDLGAHASIACPNVIIGTGHTIARLRDVPCLVIPCETAVGRFAIEVSIKHVSGEQQ